MNTTELGPKELKSAHALDSQWMIIIIKKKEKEPKDGDSFGIFSVLTDEKYTLLY